METLSKAYEAAKPVVNDAVRSTLDFVREVAEETKPVKREETSPEEKPKAGVKAPQGQEENTAKD